MSQYPVKNIKRVLKDYATLVQDGPEHGIFVKTINDDVSKIYVMLVGPRDSPYEGAFMFFTIEPGTQYNNTGTGAVTRQYPVEPPRVLFHSPFSIRCHPNLYQPSPQGGGKVCLSILGTWQGEGWVAFMTFMTIMQTILGILDNQPLCNEPAWYNKPNDPQVPLYTEYVQYVCARETLERILVPIYNNSTIAHPFADMFTEEIRMWFEDHRGAYVTRMHTLSERYNGKTVSRANVYENHSYAGQAYNYAELAERYANLH